jgi:hypothetical protein
VAQRTSLQGVLRVMVPAICGLMFAIGPMSARLAAAAEPCSNLPPSRLEVYDIKTPPVDERAVDPGELDRLSSSSPASSFHTMMLTTHDVAMVFEIIHRIVPTTGGLFCDAPELVRIAVGFPKRTAYFVRQAEQDSCIRAAMLAHEVDHRKADAEALSRLLNAKQEYISASVVALKRIPLPSPDVAVARWEASLRAVIENVRQDFLAEEAKINATVDTPAALQRIENACGGKLKRIETESPRNL